MVSFVEVLGSGVHGVNQKTRGRQAGAIHRGPSTGRNLMLLQLQENLLWGIPWGLFGTVTDAVPSIIEQASALLLVVQPSVNLRYLIDVNEECGFCDWQAVPQHGGSM